MSSPPLSPLKSADRGSTSSNSQLAAGGMRAVILVGGFGTRLRPLTFSKPKPLVPFINKPMIIYQVEALKAAGVTDIVLAVAYRPELMAAEITQWGEKLGVTFVFSHEKEPLGTAGPLALAAEELRKDPNPFFVLNSDVTCRFPLGEFLAFHRHAKSEATLLVTKVEDPSKYGVVCYDELNTGLVERFVEKPKNFVGDKINAGIYVLEKSVLDRIPLKKTSIETQTFPAIAADRKLYAMELPGFWMDIGQPKDYITGIGKYLDDKIGPREQEGLLTTPEEAEEAGYTVIGSVVVDPSATVGGGSVLGPDVTIGPNCKIGSSVRMSHSAVFDDSEIGDGSLVLKTIVAWKSSVGRWCRLVNNVVLGEDVQVKDMIYLNGVKVLPNKGVSQDYDKPEIIM